MKYDLAIIGSGSGAFAAAIKANDLGVKKVVMIEKGTIGGTCVNVGCLPSKRFLEASELHTEKDKQRYEGVKIDSKLDFNQVVKSTNELVLEFRGKKYRDVLKSLNNVEFVKGSASFISKNKLKVGSKVIEAKKFIIATGSSPKFPPIPGADKINAWTNVEALTPKKQPKSLIVVGARALGLEFAQMYSNFGTKVTILQRSDRIMPDGEPEVSEEMEKILRDEGIQIFTKSNLKSARKEGKLKVIEAEVAGKLMTFKAEEILFATGRRPNTKELNMEAVGVKTNKGGSIVVNKKLQTSAKNIWAVGDVIGNPMLETVAAKEGNIAATNAFGKKKRTMNFSAIPFVVFTSPAIATVGLTEEGLMEKLKVCSCRTIKFDMVSKAQILGDTRGLIKVGINPKTKQIMGVHIVSPIAGELIHAATYAVKHKLTIDDIIDTVHVFPTMSEALKICCQAFYHDISKLSCCSE